MVVIPRDMYPDGPLPEELQLDTLVHKAMEQRVADDKDAKTCYKRTLTAHSVQKESERNETYRESFTSRFMKH